MKRTFFKYLLVATAIVTVVIGGTAKDKRTFDLGRNMEIMVNMMHVLSNEYVDKVDADEMMKNGANGITSMLDPYTTFISEKERPSFETMISGRYGGIGSLIRKKDEYVIIAEPYKGSPADKAGLKIGDKIVAIDDKDIRGMEIGDVSAMLRGEPNTTVKVTVERLISGEREVVKIRRQRIALPSITYFGYVADGVGYIRHADFTEKCYDDMRTAILELQKEGELKSLILDYRNNGGGLLHTAIDVLSLFVPKGTMVVETRGRDEQSHKLYTQHEPLLPNTPLAVLINGNSASAAEIVAGAIQDLERGVLIGRRSFGKGLVQTTYPLGYNAQLKFTVAKYYIPSGRCIQAVNYSHDGQREEVPDSLIKEFKTARGRKVYDGGGIMPDKKMAPEYISSFALTLVYMGLIDDFGDEYMKRNYAKPIENIKTFSISDEDYAEFSKMVMARDIPYKSESRTALEKLRKSLANERNTSLNEALDAIDKGLKDDKESNLKTFRKEIVEQINRNIVLRYAYAEGVIVNSLGDDSDINEAIKLLSNKEEYDRITTKQDTERK